MKEIPLTQGQITWVDDEDYEELSKHKWTALWKPTCRTFYAIRAPSVNGRQHTVYMHRVIMRANHDQQVDHKDFDGLHNWRDNLRTCTHTQNIQHQRKRRGVKSPYKGVHPNHCGHTFTASIGVNGENIKLGSFPTAEAAALAYDEAAQMYFGAFAVTNFPVIVPGSMEQRLARGEGPRQFTVPHSRNSTGYRGVSWQKDMGRYTAKISIGKRRLHLGSFEDPVAAAFAYDAAARKHFGEFALTNF
jgi:hypothetical protein